MGSSSRWLIAVLGKFSRFKHAAPQPRGTKTTVNVLGERRKPAGGVARGRGAAGQHRYIKLFIEKGAGEEEGRNSKRILSY